MAPQQPTRSSERQIVARPVGDLLLDPMNPRLSLDANSGQETILRKLYNEEALDELAMSFARNGYFWEEPLVAVPATQSNGKYTVVEGNRRLGAIKLLLDKRLQKKLGVTDFPELPTERVPEFHAVPTVLYGSRDEVVPYLGFRHITGVKTWDPYAKARYIANLVESGRAISEIEEAIGDSGRTVKKLYQAFVVHRQIRDDLDIDDKDLRDNFSLLEVALGQQSIKKRLGIPRELPNSRIDRIVPNEELEKLGEMVSWIYGNKAHGQTRIISDSRQISSRLAPVVADEDSYQYLHKTRDLEGAYERSGGERQFLLRQLTSARRSVERALGIVPLYRGSEEVVAEIGRLETLMKSLAREAQA